jgi:hypothetical protein
VTSKWKPELPNLSSRKNESHLNNWKSFTKFFEKEDLPLSDLISEADANGLTWPDCPKQQFAFGKNVEIR